MGKGSKSKKSKLMSLLFEYLKDSNRSDRQIAKVLEVSQPTVSKMKNKLLEAGLVRNFSAIPDLAKMGYEIMAFSFVKFNMDALREVENKTKEWTQDNPEIIFSSRAEGKNFLTKNRRFGRFVSEAQYLLVDLGGDVAKHLSFKYLAEKQQK